MLEAIESVSGRRGGRAAKDNEEIRAREAAENNRPGKNARTKGSETVDSVTDQLVPGSVPSWSRGGHGEVTDGSTGSGIHSVTWRGMRGRPGRHAAEGMPLWERPHRSKKWFGQFLGFVQTKRLANESEPVGLARRYAAPNRFFGSGRRFARATACLTRRPRCSAAARTRIGFVAPQISAPIKLGVAAPRPGPGTSPPGRNEDMLRGRAPQMRAGRAQKRPQMRGVTSEANDLLSKPPRLLREPLRRSRTGRFFF